MTFVKVPAKSVTSFSNSSFFLEFMKNESIQACFNNNGFIAGGFARALLRGDSLKNYFSPNVSEPRGDVDFFFRSKEDANRAEDTIASSSDFRISPSLGKFATNVTDYRNAVGADFSRFVVQIVNAPELIFPTIEQTLQNFDLVNSQVAFDGESVFFNEDFHRLEDKKLIRINSTKSPFLGNRLFKYFNFKGLEDFEESSKDAFVDWLVKAANGAFPDFKEFHIAGALDSIKKLAYSKRIQKEDMIIFIGKVNMSEYGKNYDLALKQIGEEND